MIAKVIKYKDLPFEEGKTYKTKFQSGENFILKEIIRKEIKINGKIENRIVSLNGIYERLPNLGICPIGIDRLIPDTEYDCEIEVCSKCGEHIK